MPTPFRKISGCGRRPGAYFAVHARPCPRIPPALSPARIEAAAPPAPEPRVLTYYPLAPTDVGYVSLAGDYYTGADRSYAIFGQNATPDSQTSAWIRYPGVALTADDTVAAAVLRLVARSYPETEPLGAGEIALAWEADPDAPYNLPDYLTRPITNETAEWGDIPVWSGGVAVESPDFAAVVNEALAVEGRVSGDALLVMIQNAGSAATDFRSFYGWGSEFAAPALVLTVV